MARKLNIITGPKSRDDGRGELRWMAQAAGWVMVRRPGAIPFTMQLREWEALPSYIKQERDR